MKSKGVNQPRKVWSPAEVAQLRAIYPDRTAAQCAQVFGCSLQQIYSKATQLNIGKSEAFKQDAISGRLKGQVGAATRFGAGHQPWNKGQKGLDLGGKETQFKKGQKPRNWQPIGSNRQRHDGELERKISDTGITRHDYVTIKELVWRMHDRTRPKGYSLIFIDGDRSNIDINNLECLSRSELMQRNTRHARYPKEVNEIIQLRAALVRKINHREKKP
ncbi:HNH endonuclease signature motif containing protein [Deefgea sp. CFH1-16]|uniref:HNH endonuclease signature motif containing protein n=1 Tax=Deefgea sp. CFH1-16 TaxID=2675457 RepID=UPI0015F679C6|nr:HNH endonuclease signature motif containing protein [Deefgea sp. CFH1-16]MBM5575800.1 HNH endonuclease [Deefgea sp. CFH1-16]